MAVLSELKGRWARRWLRTGAAAALAVLALAAGAVPGIAQVFMTQEEALEEAFPGSRIERRSAYLSAEQLARARALAGDDVPVEQSVVTYYVAFSGDRPLGVAYFDVHRVRTLPEVLMIVVAPDATVEAIEVLRFAEPPEYVAPEGWLRQFPGRALDDQLRVRGGGIAGITGATLTSRAVTAAARRVLALHEVIDPLGGRRP